MNSLTPQDMERYCARLSAFNMSASAKEDAVRALHLLLTSVIDTALGQSGTDLAVKARLKDSFQASASHASLRYGQKALTVDLASHDGREGARNEPKNTRGNAP